MKNKRSVKQPDTGNTRNNKGAALIIVIFALMLFSGLAWSIMSTQST
ncbi:MAG: hypothetical protein WC335_07335 [Candidatus Omnitrophota bacterium]